MSFKALQWVVHGPRTLGSLGMRRPSPPPPRPPYHHPRALPWTVLCPSPWQALSAFEPPATGTGTSTVHPGGGQGSYGHSGSGVGGEKSGECPHRPKHLKHTASASL